MARAREPIVDRERSVVAHAGRDDLHYQAALEVGLAAEHIGDEAMAALWRAIAGLRDGGYHGVIRGPDLRARLHQNGAPESALAGLAALRGIDSATTEQTRGDAALIMREAEVRVARAELAAGLRALDADDVDAGLREARLAAARAINYSAAPNDVDGSRSVIGSLHRLYERIHDPAARTRRVTGVPTGIRAIDERIRGMQPGKLTVVAARPGAGKSAFATTVLGNLVRMYAETGFMPPVLFFSLEMELDELVQRVVWGLSGVPEHVAMYGAAPTEEARAKIGKAFNLVHAASDLIEVEARSAWTASQLDADIRRWHRRRWPRSAPKGAHGLVVIDYMQIITGDDKRADERLQISEVSKAITACSKDTGLATLGLAQTGREAEREQRLPRCRDLKGSGQLEQDAYAIAFLHPIGEEQDGLAGRDWRGSVLAIIDKVRGGGRKGIVPLHYRGECQLFSEWDRARHGNYEDVLAVSGGTQRPKKEKSRPMNAVVPAPSGAAR